MLVLLMLSSRWYVDLEVLLIMGRLQVQVHTAVVPLRSDSPVSDGPGR